MFYDTPTLSGNFIHMTCGDYSFVGYGDSTLSGNFTDIVTEGYSFGYYYSSGSTLSGTFTDCIGGGYYCFGYYGTNSGTFLRCYTYDNGWYYGTNSGAFIECYAYGFSFYTSYSSGSSAVMKRCHLSYSYGVTYWGGLMRDCVIDGGSTSYAVSCDGYGTARVYNCTLKCMSAGVYDSSSGAYVAFCMMSYSESLSGGNYLSMNGNQSDSSLAI